MRPISASRSSARRVSTRDPRRRRGDRREPDGRDDTGQPHAAERRVEQGVVGGRRPSHQRPGRAVGQHEVERADVVAEAPVDVVVLAVDVRRDGAADRDVTGPRRDREEPACGEEHRHDVAQHRAGARDDVAVVASANPESADEVEDRAAAVLRGVAVGPAGTAGEHSARSGAQQRGRHLGRRRAGAGPWPGWASCVPSRSAARCRGRQRAETTTKSFLNRVRYVDGGRTTCGLIGAPTVRPPRASRRSRWATTRSCRDRSPRPRRATRGRAARLAAVTSWA